MCPRPASSAGSTASRELLFGGKVAAHIPVASLYSIDKNPEKQNVLIQVINLDEPVRL